MKKRNVLELLFMVVYIGITYYITLPAINLTSRGFWAYIISCIIFYVIMSSLLRAGDGISVIKTKGISSFRYFLGYDKYRYIVISLVSIIAISVMIFIVNFIYTPLFMSKTYSKRIEVTNSNFTEDIKEVDFNSIPLLDKDSSQKLGDRVMGQFSEFVSQYYVSDDYRQINYNDDIIRVTPIEYEGFIKWLTNRGHGIKGYITVNSVNGETKLVQRDSGLKYMKSAFFNDNLYRVLRFKYPTTIMGEAKFEIDNDGKPYYIVPIIKYSGIGKLKRVDGIIIFDPVSAESKTYKLNEVPTWVDNVYEANLIIEQFDDYGTYQGGFLNSIFGQKNVVNTTEGYNYLAMDDDIYLYTGVTSVVSDESNLGFILSNLRTGETKFYSVPGAEEYSAMDSAKGQVQQMNYDSTFPLLINLNNKPTYLVSLKDAAGLVKMYGFVDVCDYQKVVVSDAGDGIINAANNYLKKYGDSKNIIDNESKDITINSISTAVKDGNTYYYLMDMDGNKYVASIKINDLLPYIKVGDKIKIYYSELSEDITTINNIE